MRVPHLVAVTALGAIALAACGGGGSYSSSSGSTSRPSAVASATPAAATVKTATTGLGAVLVDGSGMTLYGFTADTNGMPTCTGACAQAWPPLTLSSATLPTGLNPSLFSVVTASDGTHQLKAGKWPLYRFAGDAKPGDTNGQGSEGFFVVTPAGTLHK
jgi:predicted lipoprotein with Yx(FWY)xxD motif